MKRSLIRCSLAALALTGLLGAAHAATNYVTVLDDPTEVNLGAPGSFYYAITNCNPGDTIAFNVTNQGTGPFYFKVPFYGFPLVYQKHNITIDGYTQPGASPNTNPLTQSNNAVIKIVIDGRAGGCRNMQYHTYDGGVFESDPPIDNTASAGEGDNWGLNEQALLGIYRSTNVNVRGLAFLGTYTDIKGSGSGSGNQKGICIAQDYGGDTNILANQFAYTNGVSSFCHVNGCWFGVDPTNVTIAGIGPDRTWITSWNHGAKNGRPEIDNQYLTIGVAKGSLNPRAEFNVLVGGGAGYDGKPIRFRASGNFFGVMPDGVTPWNPAVLPGYPNGTPTAASYWRANGHLCPEAGINDTVANVIGTDGDGVNDADEGNVFGPLGSIGNVLAEMNPSFGGSPWIIAGNRFGIANDGTIWPNCNMRVLDGAINRSGCQIRFGSDFNGVGDASEANIVYNLNQFSTLYPSPAPAQATSLFKCLNKSTMPKDAWISVRGNVMVNNFPLYQPADSTASQYGATFANVVTDSAGDQGTVPSITGSTITTLTGTFSPPNTASYYTNAVVVDVYGADPEGTANGALFDVPFFGGTGSSPSGWGFPQGNVYLASYRVPNPASGAFSIDISSLGLPHGTNVTVAVTYSSFAAPDITSVSHSGTSTTLSWTGDNSGPLLTAGQGGALSGFGLQRATSLLGPWTTTYAAGNSATVTDTGSMAFYRIVGPVNGMTTLFAPAVTLP